MEGSKKENPDQQERKIPVFTVLKKGMIFKNIYLLDAPPPNYESQSLGFEGNLKTRGKQKDEEEILLVGRHPDCNIMVEHPSISRFHLRIQSNPSLQKFSVMDLSSAHGTWVSDQKIEPQVRVEMNEGDTLRLGASTRVYRFHWFPLSRAFDDERPLLSPIIEHPLLSEDTETFQNENRIPSAPPMPENMIFSFMDEEEHVSPALLFEEKENQSPLRRLEEKGVFSMWSESVNSSRIAVERGFIETPVLEFDMENQENPEMVFGEKVLADIESKESQEDVVSPAPLSEHKENQCPLRVLEEKGVLNMWSESVNSSQSPANRVFSETLIQKFEEARAKQVFAEEVLVGTENLEFSPIRLKEEVVSPAPQSEGKENPSPLWVLENKGVLSIWPESVNSSRLPVGRVSSEIPMQEFDKENQQMILTEEVLVDIENEESPPMRLKEKSDTPCLWSRRGKSASLIRVETGRSRKKDTEVSRYLGVEAENHHEFSSVLFPGLDGEIETFTPDKENMTPKNVLRSKSSKKSRIEDIKSRKSSGLRVTSSSNQLQGKGYQTVSKVLFSLSDGEEEIFTPDKENMTPNSTKKGRMEEIRPRKAFGLLSSDATSDRNSDQNNVLFTVSEKENLTPIVLCDSSKSKQTTSVNRIRQENEMIMEKRRGGRAAFQTLVVNSVSKSTSEAAISNSITTRSTNSVNCAQTAGNILPSSNHLITQPNRRWYMVVDTSSLLNKESRRSLQLLQGLKGTQLIIPRMVIRELDCLSKRGSLFRRETEASAAFQWIEDCMITTDWWIHVQNSMEEGMPIAPTPNATPQLSEEGSSSGTFTSWMSFSTRGNISEIVSPTAQDHILECALLYKRIKNDGRIALLTHDVALKIKAMAEGLLCETAEDFRESLVNPWSERFLWVQSTPRGPTWSCIEEAGFLREKHHHFPMKKTVKAAEGVKGLKLILLHNSHYGQMNPVS